MEVNAKKSSLLLLILTICIIVFVCLSINEYGEQLSSVQDQKSQFKIISSTENKDIENIIKAYAKNNNIDINIEYAGTIDIMSKLNSGENYDAVWASNSIWLYMLNDNISIKNAKSTSINPVVFRSYKIKSTRFRLDKWQ